MTVPLSQLNLRMIADQPRLAMPALVATASVSVNWQHVPGKNCRIIDRFFKNVMCLFRPKAVAP